MTDDDSQTHQDEQERHRKLIEEARRQVEEIAPVDETESVEPTETVQPEASTRTPERIGHYHTKRVLASGGMGTVYEATQEQPRRTVALKLMRHGIASRSALWRLRMWRLKNVAPWLPWLGSGHNADRVLVPLRHGCSEGYKDGHEHGKVGRGSPTGRFRGQYEEHSRRFSAIVWGGDTPCESSVLTNLRNLSSVWE